MASSTPIVLRFCFLTSSGDNSLDQTLCAAETLRQQGNQVDEEDIVSILEHFYQPASCLTPAIVVHLQSLRYFFGLFFLILGAIHFSYDDSGVALASPISSAFVTCVLWIVETHANRNAAYKNALQLAEEWRGSLLQNDGVNPASRDDEVGKNIAKLIEDYVTLSNFQRRLESAHFLKRVEEIRIEMFSERLGRLESGNYALTKQSFFASEDRREPQDGLEHEGILDGEIV
jgi:hypothetical protein